MFIFQNVNATTWPSISNNKHFVCRFVSCVQRLWKIFRFHHFRTNKSEHLYKSSKPFDIQEPFIKSEGNISS